MIDVLGTPRCDKVLNFFFFYGSMVVEILENFLSRTPYIGLIIIGCTVGIDAFGSPYGKKDDEIIGQHCILYNSIR
jgi:hypothetical protein